MKYRGVGLIRTMEIAKKSYELARSYELAPYELAQHPCILPSKLKSFFEDLYRAMPKETKVILTIRDSDAAWWTSWCNQGSTRNEISSFPFAPFL